MPPATATTATVAATAQSSAPTTGTAQHVAHHVPQQVPQQVAQHAAPPEPAQAPARPLSPSGDRPWFHVVPVVLALQCLTGQGVAWVQSGADATLLPLGAAAALTAVRGVVEVGWRRKSV